jgi:hypothetical protein
MGERPWQLTGEVSAGRRPVNSALEVDMDFETTAKWVAARVLVCLVFAWVSASIGSQCLLVPFWNVRFLRGFCVGLVVQGVGLVRCKGRSRSPFARGGMGARAEAAHRPRRAPHRAGRRRRRLRRRPQTWKKSSSSGLRSTGGAWFWGGGGVSLNLCHAVQGLQRRSRWVACSTPLPPALCQPLCWTAPPFATNPSLLPRVHSSWNACDQCPTRKTQSATSARPPTHSTRPPTPPTHLPVQPPKV